MTTPPSDADSPTARQPPNYLILAIIGFLTGLVPMAIVAIYHATRVTPAWNQNNPLSRQDAYTHSRKARNWSIATIIIAVILWTIAIYLITTR